MDPITPATDPPSPAATPPPAAYVPPLEHQDARGIRGLADHLVAEGILTRAEADASVAAELASLNGEEPPASAPAAGPTDPLPAAEVDPVFARPASPTGYRIPPATSGDLTTTELRSIQQLAWQARLPQPIFAELFSIADRYAARDMSDAELGLQRAETKAQLQRRYGAETPAKLELAKRLATDVLKANPSLLPILGMGPGDDLAFVSHLIAHAERIYGK